jgi:nucleoside triphosphatase
MTPAPRRTQAGKPKSSPSRPQAYPEVAIGTFIMGKKGELLLVKSYKWPGLYAVPGGHVELGESISQTAQREALEETGLKVRYRHAINIQQAIYPKNFFKKRHFIFIDVMCDAITEEVRLDGDELQQYLWIRPRSALRLRLNTYTRKAINDIISGKKLNI